MTDYAPPASNQDEVLTFLLTSPTPEQILRFHASEAAQTAAEVHRLRHWQTTPRRRPAQPPYWKRNIAIPRRGKPMANAVSANLTHETVQLAVPKQSIG